MYSGTHILMVAKKVYRKVEFLVREKCCWKKIKVFLFSILNYFHVSSGFMRLSHERSFEWRWGAGEGEIERGIRTSESLIRRTGVHTKELGVC